MLDECSKEPGLAREILVVERSGCPFIAGREEE
jgi:hypothetical protein